MELKFVIENTSNDSAESVASEFTWPLKEKQSRQQITLHDKERLINAIENGEDPKHVAEIFQIPYNTVRSIVYKFRKKSIISLGPRGGNRPKVINEEDGNRLLEYLEDFPEATLNEMAKFLEPKLVCSKSTIARFLKNKLITIKKIRGSVLEKNSDRVRDLRFKYVERMLSEGWRSSQCVYIDETWFNVWLRRKNGRSPRGQPLNRIIPTIKGRNISCVMAITKLGIAHFKIIEGSFKQDIYHGFIVELSQKLPNTKHYLIQDNAAIHGQCANINSQHEIVNLPPYSPFLNPIESVFSKLKRNIRSRMASIDVANTPNRYEFIKGLIETEINTGNYNNLQSYYRHISKFFFDVAQKKLIHGD